MIMTIQAWSLKVQDFTVPPRQPSLGAIAPRDGCLGGTVKSLTFRLHGSIVPFPEESFSSPFNTDRKLVIGEH